MSKDLFNTVAIWFFSLTLFLSALANFDKNQRKDHKAWNRYDFNYVLFSKIKAGEPKIK